MNIFFVRHKRKQLFVMYLWNASKRKVAKLHVLEAPKNGHVGDVARLPLPQKFDSSRTNLIECQKHHVE